MLLHLMLLHSCVYNSQMLGYNYKETVWQKYDKQYSGEKVATQWRSQPQSDARAHIFSIQLVIQVITIVTPVYVATFIKFHTCIH